MDPKDRVVFSSLRVSDFLEVATRPGEWTLTRLFDFFPQLMERRNHQGNQLSGGEQQMLAVGRALMLRPRLMLLDEPLADMDERGTECVRRLLADSEATILVTAPAGLPKGLCTREIELNPPADRTPR